MTAKMTMLEAINLGIKDAMAADESVILFGEDVADEQGGGVVKATAGLSTAFGERVRSTPISEQGFVGAGVGAAIGGMRPVVEVMMANFLAVCMDQIVNHAAKIRFMSGGQTAVPMTIRTMSGAGFQTGGQHTDWTEAWFAHTPGMKVVMPSNPADAYGLIRGCIEDDDPCLFQESMPLYWVPGEAPVQGNVIRLGEANIVKEGTDVTLITYGRGVADSMAVAQKMAADGVNAEVIDLRTISPLDNDTILNSVAKTRRAVVVHEAVRSFGVGAEISSRIHEQLFSDLKAPVQRVASSDCPTPFCKPLEDAFLYSQAEIEHAIKATLD
ncbi:alpha-ketoacid dehydrogenase subunit beta [Pseudomaricurvus alkylphenolicus]|jgi:pyruvate dehydrogenase E1 component beta subunit|uniref:alpha-ketoacid dehydrogenase subunit beta n=1 Tax=Pseudomaricurvus alkylphenolicus TaxID=1306991 RepID=UPI00141EFE07|nr:transketolase C-terminal domain-containing protein [Pseudomaricurvus alkylphenolicus]NIB38873.1 alpha-ketoacid dehydrogenase subunit beta [Pseudomaricurvus alkylphenolicus]